MERKLSLTDKQFDALDVETRRSMMQQLMFIHTPKFMYCLGAIGNYWTMARYDRDECIGKDKWEKGYTPEIIDKWI